MTTSRDNTRGEYDGISYSNLSGQDGNTLPHRFRVRDPLAKRYVSRCFSDKEKGEKWAKDQRAAFLRGTASAAVGVKWAELGASYLETLTDKGATPRYIRQVRQVVNEVVAAGARTITDEGFPLLFQRWVLRRTAHQRGRKRRAPATDLVPADGDDPRKAPRKSAQPLAASLKRRFWIIAKAVCQQAVDAPNGIPRNPLASIRKALPKVKQEAKAVFRVKELRALLADKRQDDPWWLFTALAVYTGCRATEVRSLTWRNVDLDGSAVVIPADHPGNKARRDRRIPLQPELREILEATPRAKRRGALVADAVHRQSDSNTTGYFQKYVRACGIEPEGRGPHALRHTAAALLVASGMSHFLVMDYLGHSTTDVTKGYTSGAAQVKHEVAGWERQEFRVRRGS